jgi:hypothetical protein
MIRLAPQWVFLYLGVRHKRQFSVVKTKTAYLEKMRSVIWQFRGRALPRFEKKRQFVQDYEGLLRIWEKLSYTIGFALYYFFLILYYSFYLYLCIINI